MMPKYKNTKVVINNIKFDSKLEANIYLKLLQYQKNYDIVIKLQPKYELQSKFRYENKGIRSIDYIADFELLLSGKVYVIDAKGIKTQVFKIKEKMFLKKYGKEIVCVSSLKQFIDWFEREVKI